MRKSTVLLAGILALGGMGSLAGAGERSLSLPPDSLAQWYKPANERQVWLHNMFKLRREMQAVQHYTKLQNQPLLQKWAERLATHYRKIQDMVPEWQDELTLDWADKLETAARRGDFEQATLAQRKLGQSCKSCHREFRAISAALYRTPDFSGQKIRSGTTGEEQDYGDAMEQLSQQVNGIVIAMDDDQSEAANEALGRLRAGLDDLGENCNSCHQDKATVQRILGDEMDHSLDKLAQAIKSGDKKQAGRSIGEAAVQVCARCHSIHRTLYDIRVLLK